MTDRELRLRKRIDTLTDQRDTLEAKLHTARRIAVKLRKRVAELEHSRDLWKTRARQWKPLRRKVKP